VVLAVLSRVGTARRALRLLADDGHAVHVERKGWFATG
jgi:DNA-binding GntR family transcriptional regulator